MSDPESSEGTEGVLKNTQQALRVDTAGLQVNFNFFLVPIFSELKIKFSENYFYIKKPRRGKKQFTFQDKHEILYMRKMQKGPGVREVRPLPVTERASWKRHHLSGALKDA